SLIVIGAEGGATLGALWLRGEWYRYRCKQPPRMAPSLLIQEKKDPEGADVIACVWLTITPKFDKGDQQTVNVESLLKTVVKDKIVPTMFMYGAGDKAGKEFAVDKLEKKLVPFTKKKERDEKYRLTAAVPVPDTKLTGSKLLQKSLPTADAIAKYLTE